MGSMIESQFDFAARYEVEQLESIERFGVASVIGFPDAVAVDRQQQLADCPMCELPGSACLPRSSRRMARRTLDLRRIRLQRHGGSNRRAEGDLRHRIVPDNRPTRCSQPEHGCLQRLHAPRRLRTDGLIWTSPRLALDELAITGAEGDALLVTGFFGDRSDTPIAVDLQTGLPRAPLPLDLDD
jgi:hypothetical protein